MCKILISLILTVYTSMAFCDFYAKSRLRWSSVFEVNINKAYKNVENISFPKQTYQVIAEVFYLDKNYKILKDCLIYFISKDKGQSVLKIIPSYDDIKCEQKIYNKEIEIIKNITNLKVELNSGHFNLYQDLNAFKYPINELKTDSILTFENEFRNGRILENEQVCFDIDDKCKIAIKDKCSLCPDFVQYEKSNNCQKGYRKVCTNEPCGIKGQRACIRGHSFYKELSSYCFTDSPIGYCKDDLRVLCVNNKLICR